MLTTLKNWTVNRQRYHEHPDAVIVACFYNPQRSPYRLIAFHKWYRSIKHLPHRIIECTVGEDTQSQLPSSPWITTVHAPSLLWHKETLLNQVIAALPSQYRYVFWMDTDVLLTNRRWIPEAVKKLQKDVIVQPFGYAIHLNRHEVTPNFDPAPYHTWTVPPTPRHPHMWRSFGMTYHFSPRIAQSSDYDTHGHVGFLWGARRELLDAVPLFDKALTGGADHIIAHAAAGDLYHPCLEKAFAPMMEDIGRWGIAFDQEVKGRLTYVPGDLYHLWHGDLAKRQYLPRIQAISPHFYRFRRNHDGFWIDPDELVDLAAYYAEREVWYVDDYAAYETYCGEFEADMGYPLETLCPPQMETSAPPEDTAQVAAMDFVVAAEMLADTFS